MISLNAASVLPDDGTAGTLVGRVWLPSAGGLSVVAVRKDGVYDLTARFPTVSMLAEEADPAGAMRKVPVTRISDLDSILRNTPPDSRDPGKPWLLPPIDLQVLKAAGVTFAVSMVERVIEERALGNTSAVAKIRAEVVRLVGDDLSKLKPSSPQAMRLKEVLIEQQAWSQYLEVGIGPDAEVFTKAPVLSSVGREWTRGYIPNRPGITRNRRSCSRLPAAARLSALHLAMTSTCGISRAVRRCCCRRPKCILRHWTAAAAVRSDLFARRYPQDGHCNDRNRQRWVHSRGAFIDEQDQQRP